MKFVKFLLAVVFVVTLAACGSKAKTDTANKPTESETSNGSNILVAYFSATGTTGGVAKRMAKFCGADLVEIKPEAAFTKGDLNWENEHSRSYVEMHNPDCRPAILTEVPNVDQYDLVFIGYPIWWNLPPRQINTFIEKHNLSGKKIVPFATSGSSPIDNSVESLRKLYPDLNITDGHLIDNHIKDNELVELVASERE